MKYNILNYIICGLKRIKKHKKITYIILKIILKLIAKHYDYLFDYLLDIIYKVISIIS